MIRGNLILVETLHLQVKSIEWPAPQVEMAISGSQLKRATYNPVLFRILINVKGTTADDAIVNWRAITRLLAQAEDRQILGHGNRVSFRYQHDTDLNDDILRYILRGSLTPGSGTLNEQDLSINFIFQDAVLSLWVDPFADMITGVNLNANGLINEKHVGVHGQNYVDFTEATSEFILTAPSPSEISLTDGNNGESDDWTGDKKIFICKRSDERFDDELWYENDSEVEGTGDGLQGTTTTFSGEAGPTANTSKATSRQCRWTCTSSAEPNNSLSLNVGYFQTDIAAADLPKGKFRVLARVSAYWDHNTATVKADMFEFGLGYAFGSTVVVPADADYKPLTSDAKDTWEILDLGEITIPPVGLPPNNKHTDPDLNLRIHCAWDPDPESGFGTSTNGQYSGWSLDHIFLLAIDEGVCIIENVGTDDVVVISNKGTPGVWLANTSNVIQGVATFTGGPFNIGPETTRIHWLRDDVGDPELLKVDMNVRYSRRFREL